MKTGTLRKAVSFSAGQGHYTTTLNEGDTIRVLGIYGDKLCVCPSEHPQLKAYIERDAAVLDRDVRNLLEDALSEFEFGNYTNARVRVQEALDALL